METWSQGRFETSSVLETYAHRGSVSHAALYVFGEGFGSQEQNFHRFCIGQRCHSLLLALDRNKFIFQTDTRSSNYEVKEGQIRARVIGKEPMLINDSSKK